MAYTEMNVEKNFQFLMSKVIAMAEVDIDDNDISDNAVNMTLTLTCTKGVDDDDVAIYASIMDNNSKDASDIRHIIEAMQ
jgi:hypothetical protein